MFYLSIPLTTVLPFVCKYISLLILNIIMLIYTSIFSDPIGKRKHRVEFSKYAAPYSANEIEKFLKFVAVNWATLKTAVKLLSTGPSLDVRMSEDSFGTERSEICIMTVDPWHRNSNAAERSN